MRVPSPLAWVLPALLLSASLGACNKEDEASNLAKMAAADDADGPSAGRDAEAGGQSVAGQAEAGEQPEDPGQAPSADADGFTRDAGGVPIPARDGPAKLINAGAEERRAELRLALDEGARYRITTIGMVHLPLIEKPTGFAREEELSLGKCAGEGPGRSCLLTHSYRNYEAEPPAGAGLEKEEREVAGLSTSHRIDASGLRLTQTQISGEAEAIAAAGEAGQALAEVHRMFCIRLPAEAVGEGATWKDACRLRQAGTVVTRELTWKLAKLEDSEDGVRAQLEYAGKIYKRSSDETLRTGQVQGTLFLWADAGEPHMIRERLMFTLDSGKGLSSGNDLRVQFTKVAEDGETLLRTDGKAFDQPPTALNDPRELPNGDTREAEHAPNHQPN
ncbi:hypothetical protein G6O69_19350 [Pseudenhygromyxa sp. WMMC2535]|uniref:hypothetical protein n=1 Tax=Pseudenhygromyxa sp. WMMC2535 TaxID=2712867 RepID=UPI001556D5C9|nr:hypothetical protein [Pseudenhygromyxa sp. WMMC2535]NVB40010.1 hypothetical protein [Pseudenhygromyxa sp. WMMC2535]